MRAGVRYVETEARYIWYNGKHVQDWPESYPQTFDEECFLYMRNNRYYFQRCGGRRYSLCRIHSDSIIGKTYEWIYVSSFHIKRHLSVNVDCHTRHQCSNHLGTKTIWAIQLTQQSTQVIQQSIQITLCIVKARICMKHSNLAVFYYLNITLHLTLKWDL